MQISPELLIFHELVGLEAQIIDSTDPTQIYISGIILDETKNTLKIFCNEKIKVIPKANSTFIFKLFNNDRIRINGSLLIGRSENRLSKFK